MRNYKPSFMNILLVEDDEDDRYIFLQALEKIEPSIVCQIAKNGVEALLMLNSNLGSLPECIFMDFNMPKMDGGICLKHLKSDEHLKHIPVMMISTATMEELSLRAPAANGYISKTDSISKLTDLLELYLVPQ
jgi:CheY-like chemotaxis protein